MKIPKAILDKAKNLIDSYGNNIRYLGNNENKDVFQFQFPKKERTGFPFIYMYDRHTNIVEEITGLQALRIIRETLSINI